MAKHVNVQTIWKYALSLSKSAGLASRCRLHHSNHPLNE